MIRKRYFCLLLLPLITLFRVSYTKPLTEAQFKATKLPYSVMAYSNKYAHEYGLDASKAIKLPKGLEAIKLTLSKSFSKGYGPYASKWDYNCRAELYVDKSLKILWPNNNRSKMTLPILDDRGTMKVFLATTQMHNYHGRIGPESFTSLFFVGFDKTISSGTNQIKLNAGSCSKFPSQASFPVEIWLEKSSGPHYNKLTTNAIPTPNDFYRFPLPVKYTQKYFDYTIAANKYGIQ
ncbi:hypothetical protein [Piscirickettsia litoralis]|uniref:Uncharacterized protein n=1 Tax=Piscirickettsia litoralis TaxID=1891921 RepID=A0ABX3A2U3_9GAMM|nr:hypothetical protein [Piscirickettsia litoralis]ODN43196.1 hypothetical protein BGC07_10045 [Piscirickettsia litoralis]